MQALLARYDGACVVTFGARRVNITNSYLVRGRAERLAICAILASCERTVRTANNLSAEWVLHNAAYRLHVLRRAARDVDLDYDQDPRALVRLCTKLLERMGLV